MKRVLVIVLVATMLAACGGLAPLINQGAPARDTALPTQGEAGSPLSTAMTTHSPGEAAARPAGTAAKAPPPLAFECVEGTLTEAILVKSFGSRSQPSGFEITPFNPHTGKAICGYPPIRQPAESQAFLSPSRKKLALFNYGNEPSTTGAFQLVNLLTWETKSGPFSAWTWVDALAFSPDEARLVFSYVDSKAGALDGKQRSSLVQVDLKKMEILSQTILDFQPKKLAYTQAGSDIIVYGAVLGEQDRLEPAARLVLLDDQTLSPRWEAPLPHLLHGFVVNKDSESGIWITEWEPAVVFSHDQNVLYIVPVDDEVLITVDIAGRSLRTQAIRPSLSFLDRLLAFFSPGVAHAKIANGSTRLAALSKDGKVLYLTGWTNSSTQDEQGRWTFSQTPHGLSEIELATGLLRNQVDVDATYLVLSLDFGYLLLGGWDGQRPTTTIVDVQRLKILEQLEGVFVYVARNRQGETFLLAVRQEGGRAKATLLDPISLAEGSQWEVEVLEIVAIL